MENATEHLIETLFRPGSGYIFIQLIEEPTEQILIILIQPLAATPYQRRCLCKREHVIVRDTTIYQFFRILVQLLILVKYRLLVHGNWWLDFQKTLEAFHRNIHLHIQTMELILFSQVLD